MGFSRDLDAVADACIEAAQLVNRHGSPALQQAMRVVLYILGFELSRRMAQTGQAQTRTQEDEAFSRIVGKRSG